MKFLAMHITNQKFSFDIFTIGNVHPNDLHPIIVTHTMYCCLLLQIYLAAYDCVCAPETHIVQIECWCWSLFQVVIESVVERKSWGDIAVDDIKILDNLNMADCKGQLPQNTLR